ncbi:dihydrodipicolinate reductase [Candidatus Parcubacteria bacterium]|nr:dihydrodipicolinate reductase [Patescibacteria group bacterium]MBU4309003.1 dihydrodipicolinate reductase [Patescibacteria group bacterium]MBU4432403.1 dihydrodipicolinate reductase [Patescibacteria group bacterium]MBU4577363.1 dihydrodipicolinate reductase [Patescibacteria group bacterium]MCG2697051.1 dihydrodipicolinate reductase [Candidatus Parcubacteria bacterium]
MKKIPVLLAGLPGNMALMLAERITRNERYMLVPYAFTGPGLGREDYFLDFDLRHTSKMTLLEPSQRQQALDTIISAYPDCIVVDFTQPNAANDNCEFYSLNKLPFVMGTTGGDRALLAATVKRSLTVAVIAPNMSIPVVMMMDMIEYAAKNYPNALSDWQALVIESHQAAKKDKSGTAIAIGKLLCKLGVNFTEDNIRAIRDPFEQGLMGVPPTAFAGHGFHRYHLGSPDGNVSLGFEHNVCGRETYVDGTLKAVDFLAKKIAKGVNGKCFSMIDVMRG